MPNFPRDSKLQGEWAEICFLKKATSEGLTVSKPYGESAKYDFVVEHHGRLSRVQVKSVSIQERGLYQLKTVSGSTKKHFYTSAQVDFIVAYILPVEIWYVIPIRALQFRKTIRLGPDRPAGRPLERYREAWQLLRLADR
jgi:hypothetical protein